MTSPLILFTAPLARRFVLVPPLSVTGTLPGYRAGDAFEARLQINNSIGACTVDKLSGSLPAGASIEVDNGTKEVVIKWPAYTVPVVETPTPIPNAGFEQGDKLWKKSAGWTIQNFGAGSYAVTEGAWSAVFSNARGTGDLIGLPVPVSSNDPITLTCDIQQGGSSSGNVAARVALVWFNGDVQLPEASLGNVIVEGSSGAWATSTVTASKPVGATHVAAGVTATRKRQNKPLFVDNFHWNLSYPTGTDSDLDYNIALKVTDSAGRVAYWSGIVSENYVYLTSKLYGLTTDEGALVALSPTAFTLRDLADHNQIFSDDVVISLSPTDLLIRSILIQPPDVFEDAIVGLSPRDFVLRDVLITAPITAENTNISLAPAGFVYKVQPNYQADAAVTVSLSPQGLLIT